MTLGISKIRPNYVEWLRDGDTAMEIIDLSIAENPAQALHGCDALVLTGGEDVHPARYGRPEDVALCGAIDEARDSMEFDLIREAIELKLPVLAICRGLQILNVACGGTLFADIYSQNNITQIHTKNETTTVDARHSVAVVPGTLLYKIVRTTEGEINSAHHQAVRDIAEELFVSARSADGTVEALEWKEMRGNAFLLAVQWHPERMEQTNPFAQNILHHFLFEAAAHAALNTTV